MKNLSLDKNNPASHNILCDKRGEGTPIWLIIALILGIIVLVVIALGFTQGWSNLFDKLNLFGGKAHSITSVGQGCQIVCASGDSTAWNVQKRTVEGLSDKNVIAIGLANDKLENLGKGEKVAIGDTSIEVSGRTANKRTVEGITCAELATKGLIDPCANF